MLKKDVHEIVNLYIYIYIIPVEIRGERLYPLVVGTFWLGTPPQTYKKQSQVPTHSLQKANQAKYKKVAHRPNGFKVDKNHDVEKLKCFL